MLPRQDASAYSPTALLEVQHPLKEGREEDCAECNPDNSSVIPGITARRTGSAPRRSSTQGAGISVSQSEVSNECSRG